MPKDCAARCRVNYRALETAPDATRISLSATLLGTFLLECVIQITMVLFCKGRHPAAAMARSSKLVASKKGRVLLVRRRGDKLWMFPGGRKRGKETEKQCLRREIKEELPKIKLGRIKLWREVKATNRRSGRKMNDAIFITEKASGTLKIGDRQEIDRASWRKPGGLRLTPTSRFIRDKLFRK